MKQYGCTKLASVQTSPDAIALATLEASVEWYCLYIKMMYWWASQQGAR